jgi:hypothetical protein
LQNLLVYFCDSKKRKRETEPLCNCKKFALVIATRSYMCLKKRTDAKKKQLQKKTVAKNTQVNASAKKTNSKKKKAP